MICKIEMLYDRNTLQGRCVLFQTPSPYCALTLLSIPCINPLLAPQTQLQHGLIPSLYEEIATKHHERYIPAWQTQHL